MSCLFLFSLEACDTASFLLLLLYKGHVLRKNRIHGNLVQLKEKTKGVALQGGGT